MSIALLCWIPRKIWYSSRENYLNLHLVVFLRIAMFSLFSVLRVCVCVHGGGGKKPIVSLTLLSLNTLSSSESPDNLWLSTQGLLHYICKGKAKQNNKNNKNPCSSGPLNGHRFIHLAPFSTGHRTYQNILCISDIVYLIINRLPWPCPLWL